MFSDDLYERLGLARTASNEEVRRSYRALLRQYTPERAEDEFKRIREAYETLSDPESRNQYDNQPDPALQRILESAQHAMTERDYPTAERFLKQALVHEPALGFARNFLGLCFLYQHEPQKAVSQYERLLRIPDAPASWFGNAGHAYRMSNRARDAELAFKEAIARCTDNPVDYVEALADLYLERDDFGKATGILKKGIEADGVVDFQDLRYFTKLLEIRLRQNSDDGVSEELQRIRAVAQEEDQRSVAAVRLGLIAQHLLAAWRFRHAKQLAETARALDPADPDNAALESVAGLLAANKLWGAVRVVGTHPSFKEDGWLHGIRGLIEDYCTTHKVLAEVEPNSTPPTLRTINGIGTKLYGSRDEDAHTNSYVATLYFVFLFVPIVPLGSYRVVPHAEGGWGFIGKVPFSNRERWHLGIALLVILLWISWASASSSDVASGGSGGYPATQASPIAVDPAVTASPSSDWYTLERSRVQQLEDAVTSFDASLAEAEAYLERQKRRIAGIENGVDVVTTSDPEYTAAIDRYNRDVRDYNAVLAQRRTAYGIYKIALDAFNARVDAANAGR